MAYKSRKLSDTKKRYPIHDKELLAIVPCLEKWRCYLEGVLFITCLTDHKSLIYFKIQAPLLRQQAKWMKTVEHFNIKIEYKPGRELVTADALSRLMTRSAEGSDALDEDWPMLYAGDIDKDLPSGTSPKTRNMVISSRDKFRMVSGLVTRVLDDGSTVPYIPVAQRVETVLRYHRDLGHTRSRNLYEFLRARMWWPKMLPYIEGILAQCEVCEKFAPSSAPPKSSLPVPDGAPFQKWALDVIGA